MNEVGNFFSFIDSNLIESQETNDAILAVADSWLVEDGRVRSLNAHFERFASSINEPEVTSELPHFFTQVTEKLPRTGRWFPRIELHETPSNGSRLHLRLRAAPEEQTTISLWTHPDPDPRISHQIKGPDLSLGMQLRRAAQMHGADEAVILNSEGYVSEGALSSILWWRDDVLCAPGKEVEWLPSVTRTEIFSIAEQMGLSTRTEKVKPADLVGLEIWCISSLQGIRPVETWINLGAPVGMPKHLDAFNKRLRLLGSTLD